MTISFFFFQNTLFYYFTIYVCLFKKKKQTPKLLFFHYLADGRISELNSFDTRDGLYDCSWSEENERHVVTASGDGSVKLFDTLNRSGHPLKSYHEHTHEVNSVDWNLVRKDLFVSGSWDETIKLWNPVEDRSIQTWKEHTYCVYS